MKIPYKAIGQKKEKPLLYVTIRNPANGRSRRFLGLVDSGSDSCFFDAQLGESIGLKIKNGKPGRVQGVVPGKWVSQFTHELYIDFEGKSYAIQAGFVDGLGKHGYGILGQTGFFDLMEAVVFEKKKGVFEVII